MNSNIELTKEILTNNVFGSFLLVVHRTPDPDGPVEFIKDAKVACYHYLILRVNEVFAFYDIMDSLHYPHDDLSFTYFQHNLKSEFYVSEDDFAKKDDKNKKALELYEQFTKILTNKAQSILYLKDPLCSKVAAYKVKILGGQDITTYKTKIKGNKVIKMQLVNKDHQHILKDLNTQSKFVDWFQTQL